MVTGDSQKFVIILRLPHSPPPFTNTIELNLNRPSFVKKFLGVRKNDRPEKMN